MLVLIKTLSKNHGLLVPNFLCLGFLDSNLRPRVFQVVKQTTGVHQFVPVQVLTYPKQTFNVTGEHLIIPYSSSIAHTW